MDSRGRRFCLRRPVFNGSGPNPSPLTPGQRPTGGNSSSLKRTTMLVFAAILAQYPGRDGSRLSFALRRTGGNPGDIRRLQWHWPLEWAFKIFRKAPQFPLPLATGRTFDHPVIHIWRISGIVEPIGGLLAVLIAGSVTPLMPWFLFPLPQAL